MAHNAIFDVRMLKSEFDRVGLKMAGLADGHVDTLRLAQNSLPISSRSLDSCLAFMGITNEQAHSALSDARATGRLLTRFLLDELPNSARSVSVTG